MSLSYKDALILGKSLESPIKSINLKTHTTCNTYTKLSNVNPIYFSKVNCDILISKMHDKLNEINMWKLEDNNQLDDIQIELSKR